MKLLRSNKSLFLAVMCLASVPWLPGLSVYQVKIQSQADVLVYEVDHDYQADLIVYSSTFPSDGGRSQPFVWYAPPLVSRADLKIFYVTYPIQADLLIYFTDKPYKVGWVNPAKKLQWDDKFEPPQEK